MVIDFTPYIDSACRSQLMFMGRALVRALIKYESSDDPLAVGDGGRALGLMQVHREAAEDVQREDEWDQLKQAIEKEDEETAARLSIEIGVAYLQLCLKQFGGNEPWALGAYNQGRGVIGKAKKYADAVLALKVSAG